MPSRTLGVIAAVALISALTACSSAAPQAHTPVAPQDGGTLVFATDVEPSCFDPAAPSQIATQIIQRNVFDSLIYQDVDGAFHPWLASEWSVSADGREYEFTIREGVTFHNGETLDAQAVKATFDHFVAPETKAPLAGSLPDLEVVVDDPQTLRVALSEPFAPFLQLVSFSVLGIQAPAALALTQAELCAGGPNAIGTGPFVSDTYTKGQSLILSRNADYDWAADGTPEGAAHIDAVEIRFLPEASVRVGALASGQASLAANVPPTNAEQVESSGAQILSASAAGTPFAAYVNTQRAPLDDERVRQALQVGLDIDGVVDSVYAGRFPRAWSALTPTTPNSYDASLEGSWPRDADAAAALLDEAGWNELDADGYRVRDGERLSLTWIQNTTVMREQRDITAQGLAADAKNLGIEITVEGLEAGAFADRAKAGDYDITDMSNQRADGDMLYNVWSSTLLATSGGANYSLTSDPEIDGWLSDGVTAVDQGDRVEPYSQLQQRVVGEARVIPIYVPQYLLGVAPEVHDVNFTVSGYPDSFRQAWIEE